MSVNILNIAQEPTVRRQHIFVSFYLFLSARSSFRLGFGLIPSPDRAALTPNHKESWVCAALIYQSSQHRSCRSESSFPLPSHGVDLRIKLTWCRRLGFSWFMALLSSPWEASLSFCFALPVLWVSHELMGCVSVYTCVHHTQHVTPSWHCED